MILTKDNIVEYCKEWFRTTNTPIPRKVNDWKYTGKSIPPGTSATILRKLDLKISDLINMLHGEQVSKSNRSHNLEDLLLKIGLRLIHKHYYGDMGKYTLEYECLLCNGIDTTDQSTPVRWLDRGCYGCPTCRQSTGKVKSLEFYQDKVTGFTILSRPDNKHFLIKCNDCCGEFTRSLVSLYENDKAGTSIQCPHCSVSNAFIKGRLDGWDSEIEKACVTRLIAKLPGAEVRRQTYYNTITNTTKGYTADVYLPEYSCIIEITSRHNKIPNYFDNLSIKENIAKESGVLWFLATSTSEIDDIVQALLKSKE